MGVPPKASEMRSRPTSNGHSERDEPDDAVAIPDFARAWESDPQVASVRRPSTSPDPQSYHEAIEPETIFELDKRQADGSIETILVVPFGCKRCRFTAKQACSRGRPTCVRCKNANGARCEVDQGGYQRLPGPKFAKSSPLQKQKTNRTCDRSVVSNSAEELNVGRAGRARRRASGVGSLSQGPPSDSELSSVTLASKRPLSPEYCPLPPRKKAQIKTTSRKRTVHNPTVTPSTEANVECSEISALDPSAQALSAGQRSDSPKWTFVNGDAKRSSRGQEHTQSMPSNTPIPRVWTNVRIAQRVW